MNIIPFEDNNSNFELIMVKNSTPHCNNHGAMNKVSSFDGGGYWRCNASIADKSKQSVSICRAGCIQTK